jgi:hypothetical protein
MDYDFASNGGSFDSEKFNEEFSKAIKAHYDQLVDRMHMQQLIFGTSVAVVDTDDSQTPQLSLYDWMQATSGDLPTGLSTPSIPKACECGAHKIYGHEPNVRFLHSDWCQLYEKA